MRNRKKISCLLLFVCSLLFSCSENALYFQYQVIQDTAWEKSKVYYFTFFVVAGFAVVYQYYTGVIILYDLGAAVADKVDYRKG